MCFSFQCVCVSWKFLLWCTCSAIQTALNTAWGTSILLSLSVRPSLSVSSCLSPSEMLSHFSLSSPILFQFLSWENEHLTNFDRVHDWIGMLSLSFSLFLSLYLSFISCVRKSIFSLARINPSSLIAEAGWIIQHTHSHTHKGQIHTLRFCTFKVLFQPFSWECTQRKVTWAGIFSRHQTVSSTNQPACSCYIFLINILSVCYRWFGTISHCWCCLSNCKLLLVPVAFSWWG